MKTVKTILSVIAIGVLIASCNKEVIVEEETTDSESTNSTSQENDNSSTTTNNAQNTGTYGSSSISNFQLEATETQIPIGGSTQITASANGDGLSYSWSTNSGDLLGSGNQIMYGASGCCGGTNTVTCTVKDAGNHEEAKSILIVVQ